MTRPDLEAIATRAHCQADPRARADLLALLAWVAMLEDQMRARAEREMETRTKMVEWGKGR